MRSGFLYADIDTSCLRAPDFRRLGRGVGVVLLAALLLLLGGEIWRANALSQAALRSSQLATNHLPRSQPVAVPVEDSAPLGANGPLELGPVATEPPAAPTILLPAVAVLPAVLRVSIAAFLPGDSSPRAPPRRL